MLLLLAAVITAPLAAQELRLDVSSQERPAACHEDGPSMPAPAPVTHNCCMAAHHPAILPQSSAFRTSLCGSARIDSTPQSVTVARRRTFPNLLILPGDPPAPAPLRV